MPFGGVVSAACRLEDVGPVRSRMDAGQPQGEHLFADLRGVGRGSASLLVCFEVVAGMGIGVGMEAPGARATTEHHCAMRRARKTYILNNLVPDSRLELEEYYVHNRHVY